MVWLRPNKANSSYQKAMNVVFIVPTGLGCDIGGHAGDATPAARLIAECCDKLILHPNVVNASDINEMPENALYVEGSMLDRFLEGGISLQEVNSNRILVVVNKPAQADTINAISAARATLGINATILELDTPFTMKGFMVDGVACGEHSGIRELIAQVSSHNFDALAICSVIDVPPEVARNYFKVGGVNPWGGIEAIISKIISDALQRPVAHAPIESETTKEDDELFYLAYEEVVDPKMAAEVVSSCYTHCILKGLNKAPRIRSSGIHRDSVGCMITPSGCVGRPHEACFDAGIPVIAVQENDSHQGKHDDRIIYVQNYLEAAGMISLLKAGVTVDSVTRIKPTAVI